jgi:hypothetical protein
MNGVYGSVVRSVSRWPTSSAKGVHAHPHERSSTGRKGKYNLAQLEHIEAIEKRLWGAADTLRANSSYASNEYFLPVMGLVFLRHAFSRFLGVSACALVAVFGA